MNIIVFGANGNIGKRVVSRLLANGHRVTAFVHTSSELPEHESLKVVFGDIHEIIDIRNALTGNDIVISTLGSWGTQSKDILSSAMTNIIPIMQELSIKRIISLTGSGILLPSDETKWYDKLNPLLLRYIAPKILIDGKKHIELLKKSSLDWTVVRSSIMKNGKARGYSFTYMPPALWNLISRDDVADSLVALIDLKEYSNTAPFIS